MQKRDVVVLLAVLAVAGCGTTAPHPARWHPNGGPPRDENWHSPNAALMQYDSNHDGVLTRTELLAGLKAEFDAYDTDHNNCLAVDEVRAINQARVKQDASQATPLVDWNQDGCIDFHEYSAPALSLFDSLDTNGDGQLTAKEINPASKGTGPKQEPPGGKHGRGRGGPPGEEGDGGSQ